jgi:hypothetical protein
MICHNSPQGDSVQRWACWFQSHGYPVLALLADAPHVRRFDLFVSLHDRSRPPMSPSLLTEALTLEVTPAGLHVWAETSDVETCRVERIEWAMAMAFRASGVQPGRYVARALE